MVVATAKICALSRDQRLASLHSSSDGLAEDEVGRRLRTYGPNALEAHVRGPWWRTAVANFTHPLALLLWFGAVMALAARTPELALAIIAVLVVNGLFATLQEHRAERVVDALLARAALSARVLRDRETRTIPASELVPGDVVKLTAGDVVPADCVLVTAHALSIDLSMLTGETRPVDRTADPDTGVDPDLVRRTCFTPAGSGVLRGSGDALVVATGAASSLGTIESMLVDPQRGSSLLERQVGELSRLTAVIAVVCGAATLALAIYSRGTGIVAALTFGTGVIVALVPEGLLPLLTVSLAMAARRMADRGALVRRLAAVEIVGASTVICTDKTGTLTQNTLAVLAFIAREPDPDIADRARRVAALCNDASDPIDRALLAWVGSREADDVRRANQRVSSQPFDANQRYMRVVCLTADGERQFIKGAPESVVALVGDPLPAGLSRELELAASEGDRVLLLADGPAGGRCDYVGLLRMHDPPRPEVPAALEACRRAGIRVTMLTGDHRLTARAVATRIGLADATANVVEGSTLDGLDDHELATLLRSTSIFARVTPEHKLRIVRALRADGEIVTVTGDGVNDAPALRMADVGIAMGRRGTEVAKQASDIVLLDENFATIVAAIEEGRAIKHNIRRFISYIFTSNVPELVPFLFFIFASVPLPLTILQILAIDLGTDMLPALALGFEPPAAGALGAQPESPRSRLLTRSIAIRSFLFYGVIESAVAMIAFAIALRSHGVAATATTLTFLGIVGGQIGCLFAVREGTLQARLSMRRNPWIALGLAVEVALALALVYVPGLGSIFSMTAVSPPWLLVLPIAAGILIAADQARRALRSAP